MEGSEAEYIKYPSRKDADVQNMWEWDLMSNIGAIGVSVVPKKNPTQQRKLIMQVASNYMLSDPPCRVHLGMFGGALFLVVLFPLITLEWLYVMKTRRSPLLRSRYGKAAPR